MKLTLTQGLSVEHLLEGDGRKARLTEDYSQEMARILCLMQTWPFERYQSLLHEDPVTHEYVNSHCLMSVKYSFTTKCTKSSGSKMGVNFHLSWLQISKSFHKSSYFYLCCTPQPSFLLIFTCISLQSERVEIT